LSNIETVCEAIATRHLLQICYQDHYRIVEPNAYGSNANGNPVLLAWQVEGGGGWDNGHGWRVLPISAMERVTLLDDTFAGPRPYQQHDSSPLTVYARA
jgi:hypothetical protein